MTEIKKVLVTAYVGEDAKKKLADAFAPAEVKFVLFMDKPKILEEIRDADVAILNGDVESDVLEAGKGLKWIHSCRAGQDKSDLEEIFRRGIVMTSSAGKSAPAIGEHAFMFMIALTYDVPMLERAKKDHKWAVSREYFMRTGMFGKTVGILGLGRNGLEVAKLCKSAFNMKVLGYRLDKIESEYIDRCYAVEDGETYEEILKESDFIVLCLELNDSTYHMIGREQFAKMKKSAYLINVGRGGLVDEPAMIEAIHNKEIAGAGLDTFETEPLPADSPLWDEANVMITPHITPQLPDRDERTISYVLKNIEAYRNNGTMTNLVRPTSILSEKK